MADSTANEVTESAANLHLDEVTGESVSKTELKRRQKQRARDEKKQQRTAAAPPRTEGHRSTEDDESSLTPNVGRVLSACCAFSLTSPLASNILK